MKETFGRDIEPMVNHLVVEMMPHLPEDAADMCEYLLEFATHENKPAAAIESYNSARNFASLDRLIEKNKHAYH